MFREVSLLVVVFLTFVKSQLHHGAYSYSSSSLHSAGIAAAPLLHAAPTYHHLAAPVVHLQPTPHEEHQEIDYHAHPKYEFKYGVDDHHTHDHKSQSESRDGDHTHGEYSVVEPDGTILTVHYSVVGKSGFNAVVHRTGHASHPSHYHH